MRIFGISLCLLLSLVISSISIYAVYCAIKDNAVPYIAIWSILLLGAVGESIWISILLYKAVRGE